MPLEIDTINRLANRPAVDQEVRCGSRLFTNDCFSTRRAPNVVSHRDHLDNVKLNLDVVRVSGDDRVNEDSPERRR